ncbi:MAG: hypothetical protein AABY18_02870 [Candidatus Thermoplasmatota archaeon]
MPTATEILAVALPLLVGIALLALATLVLRKGGAHLHTRLFGVLFLLSGVKSLGDGLTAPFKRADGTMGFVANELHASSPLFPDALTWLYVTIVCALAMLPLLFLFCATFPRPQPWMVQHRWRGVLVFVPSLVVGWVVFLAQDSPWFNDIVLGFNVVATTMTAAALWLLVRTHRRSPDHIERKQATYVALGFLPSFMATWVITFYIFGAEGGWLPADQAQQQTGFVLRFLSPIFEMVAAGLVGFAILKYNILGVDPKFRVGVKSAVVGFVFVVVFLVTQAIENIVLQGQLFAFAGEYGSFLLSGTTSIVLFKPIERMSGKVSDKLLPRPAEGDAALARAAEVYHAQCTYVLRDAQVSEREMAFLRNLRTQLGLSEAQARAIEEKVERILKVDAPEMGATSGTAAHHVAAAHAAVTEAEPEVRRASPVPGQDAGPTAPLAPAETPPQP